MIDGHALNIVLALLFYKRFRISLYRLETSSSRPTPSKTQQVGLQQSNISVLQEG
jgi:hypothetical protein